MAVWQGSNQSKGSNQQSRLHVSAGVHGCAGRLDMRSQGRVGGELEGCNPSSVPCVIVILYLSFLSSFLVLEEVVGDFVVHEQKDYEMNAHVVLERVVDRCVTSCLTCAKRASRERTQRAHAQGHRQSTRAPRHSPFPLFPLYCHTNSGGSCRQRC